MNLFIFKDDGPQIQNAAKIYHFMSYSIMVESILYAIISIRNLENIIGKKTQEY